MAVILISFGLFGWKTFIVPGLFCIAVLKYDRDYRRPLPEPDIHKGLREPDIIPFEYNFQTDAERLDQVKKVIPELMDKHADSYNTWRE